MGNPACELADRIQLLGFEKLRNGMLTFTRALLDPAFQVGVKLLELFCRSFERRGAFRNTLFEHRVERLELPGFAVQFAEDFDLRA